MTIKVAMVGCGYFGQFHLNAWLRMEDVTLVGVVVRSAERRAELAELYPNVFTCETLDEILQLGELDLLDVTTPPSTHAEIITPLLGSIKTIICQKPFCRNLDEATALAANAEASTTDLIVHENFRFMPWYRKIKEVLDSEALGTVRQAQFKMRPGDGGGADAYLARQPYFREMERFLVHETGIHWIDTFRYLFGEPESVYADVWRTNPVIAGEDSGLLLFRFPSGERVIYDGNRTLDHAADNHRLTMGEFMIEGTDATLTLDGFGKIRLRKFGEKTGQDLPYVYNDIDFGGDCVHAFQSHVIAHLTNGSPIETSADHYLTNMTIEEEVYRSAKSGQSISLL